MLMSRDEKKFMIQIFLQVILLMPHMKSLGVDNLSSIIPNDDLPLHYAKGNEQVLTSELQVFSYKTISPMYNAYLSYTSLIDVPINVRWKQVMIDEMKAWGLRGRGK